MASVTNIFLIMANPCYLRSLSLCGLGLLLGVMMPNCRTILELAWYGNEIGKSIATPHSHLRPLARPASSACAACPDVLS